MKEQLRTLLLRIAAAASSPAGSAAPGPPRNILLVRPDHLGDVLFLTPALRALRIAQPTATITALVGPWAAGILADNPDVDRVEPLPFPWFDRQPRRNLLDPYLRLFRAARALRGRFDTAIICRFDHWWGAWLAAAAGIPRIIGYDREGVRPFLTESVPYRGGRHEVLQNLALLHGFNVPLDPSPDELPLRFTISERDRAALRSLLEPLGGGDGAGPLVALHPGSGAAVKRWSSGLWGAWMARLHERYGARFVVTGGPGEEELAAEVVRAAPVELPVLSVAARTSLRELAALFERCALVAGPDSGPLHLAVAMGRPTIHLYGPVDPATFGPWGRSTSHVVITRSLACQFCNRLDWGAAELSDHPCVSGIPLMPVLAAAEQLLGRVEGRAPGAGLGHEERPVAPGDS